MRPTKEGRRLILATLLIAAAAFNTGNNLIYLIFAMLMSILFLSFALLYLNLRGVSVSISAMQPVFARQRAFLIAEVKNSKKSLPSYSLRIKMPSASSAQSNIPKVGANSTFRAEISAEFSKRGVYSCGDFYLESGFPFIFFMRAVKACIKGEVTVYPEIVDIAETPGVTVIRDREGQTVRAGSGEDILTIRELRYGDDLSKIHWKASAKAEKLMVREYGEDEPTTATLILDDIAPLSPPAFEKAVSIAASYAMMLVESGYFVSIISCRKSLPLGSGMEHLYKLLDLLASVKEHDMDACPMDDEIQGMGILIIKSGRSSLARLAHLCHVVVDASGVR